MMRKKERLLPIEKHIGIIFGFVNVGIVLRFIQTGSLEGKSAPRSTAPTANPARS